MIRRTLLVMVFVLTSVIEVRVRAAKSADEDHDAIKGDASSSHQVVADSSHAALPSGRPLPVSDPENCLQRSTFPCAVQINDKQSWTWIWPQGRAEFKAGTVAVLLGEGDVKVVQGELVLYSVSGAAWLRTLFGDVAVSEGIVMLRRQDAESFEISTLQGEAQLFPKGGKETLAVPAGFRNWLSGVGHSGVGESGIPQAANKERVLKVWAKGFAGEKLEFFELARGFHSQWMKAVEQAGPLHRQLVERSIASLEEERQAAARAAAQREKERRELRALFRRKNYLD